VFRPIDVLWLLVIVMSFACASGPGAAACPGRVGTGPDKARSGGSGEGGGGDESIDSLRADAIRAGAVEAEIAAMGLPPGRSIGSLSREGCMEILTANDVDAAWVADADGAEMPVRLDSPIRGVTVEHRGRSETHAIIDCRLVVATLAWSPYLRQAGVSRLVHYSVFRPGAVVRGTRSTSGHASAMAIDVGIFELDDGRTLDVVEVWTDRRRDLSTCPAPPLLLGVDAEPVDQALLRGLVCQAVRDELFQVVLTPHHDDAHRNHVHFEVRPDVDWTIVD
jgi:hypothetical protein